MEVVSNFTDTGVEAEMGSEGISRHNDYQSKLPGTMVTRVLHA